MARVMELLKRSDGVARAALINVSNENGPPKILKRSIRHIIPIEVRDTDDEITDTDSPETEDHDASTTDSPANIHPPRPTRQAAILGEAVRRAWTGQ